MNKYTNEERSFYWDKIFRHLNAADRENLIEVLENCGMTIDDAIDSYLKTGGTNYERTEKRG